METLPLLFVTFFLLEKQQSAAGPGNWVDGLANVKRHQTVARRHDNKKKDVTEPFFLIYTVHLNKLGHQFY